MCHGATRHGSYGDIQAAGGKAGRSGRCFDLFAVISGLHVKDAVPKRAFIEPVPVTLYPCQHLRHDVEEVIRYVVVDFNVREQLAGQCDIAEYRHARRFASVRR